MPAAAAAAVQQLVDRLPSDNNPLVFTTEPGAAYGFLAEGSMPDDPPGPIAFWNAGYVQLVHVALDWWQLDLPARETRGMRGLVAIDCEVHTGGGDALPAPPLLATVKTVL